MFMWNWIESMVQIGAHLDKRWHSTLEHPIITSPSEGYKDFYISKPPPAHQKNRQNIVLRL